MPYKAGRGNGVSKGGHMEKSGGPGRALKFKTVKELQKRIDAYFDLCDEKGRPYTMCGLAGALGTDRRTLRDYEAEGNEKFLDAVKKAKLRIEESLEARLSGTNVTGTIFNLKNNFGWKDKTEQYVTGNLCLEEKLRGITGDKY